MEPREACGRSHPQDPVERERADRGPASSWKEGGREPPARVVRVSPEASPDPACELGDEVQNPNTEAGSPPLRGCSQGVCPSSGSRGGGSESAAVEPET